MDALLFVLLLLLGALPWLMELAHARATEARGPSSRRHLSSVLLGLGVLGAGAAWAASSLRPSLVQERDVTDRPIETLVEDYVGSDTCRACHPGEHSTWDASYHSRMTQHANAAAVLGDFDDVTLEAYGGTVRLSREGDDHWAELEDPDGQRRRHLIVMTTGSHHMQAYWYSSGHARELGQLPFIWLVDDEAWARRNAVFLRPPGLPIDETRRWNITCNKCHSTRPRPRVADIEAVDTEVVEFGIACEACHGPGGRHVSLNQDPLRRARQHRSEEGDESIVNPARLDHERAAHVCAQCHGLFQFKTDEELETWKTEGYSYRPGDLLTDTRFFVHVDQQHEALRLHLREDPTYFERKFWADGMIRMAGREMIGLLNTPCFTDGEMTCISCHRLHVDDDDPRTVREWANDQLDVGMDGRDACTQCHEEMADDASLSAHTHHAPESAGSNCYDCHMPHVSYALMSAIRTHHLESPSVPVAQRTGRPVACNQCHLDQTLEWTAQHLHDWYGQPLPPLGEDERRIAASILWIVRGDATQRALMAWTLGWSTAQETAGRDWLAPYLGQLLDDPYEVVRLMALHSLRTLPGFEDFDYDFVGPMEERQAAGWEVFRRFAAQRAERRGRGGEPLPMDERGRLEDSVLRRLLEQRDHRRIELDE